MDDIASFVRVFATSMHANRLQHFGWEKVVSFLDADRLRLLADQIPSARDVLLTAADMKEQRNGTS